MKNDVFKNYFAKLEPDIDKGEPIVKLRPDRRGPVEQEGCLGGVCWSEIIILTSSGSQMLWGTVQDVQKLLESNVQVNISFSWKTCALALRPRSATSGRKTNLVLLWL